MTTATQSQPERWTEIAIIWKDNRWLYSLMGILLGILFTPAIEQITGDLNDLIGNLVPEAVGIVFTVLILNRFAENRTTEQLKRRLVREAGSQSNETAKAAVDWMRAEGWLDKPNSLLKGANLGSAKLSGASFVKCNLEGVTLFDANLQK